jgi:hypothetical protein
VILCQQNEQALLSKFIPASLLGVFAGFRKTAMMDLSGMIRTKTGTHTMDQKMAVVHGMLCTIPLCNNNQ